MLYRLFAFDLDGTLLTPDGAILTEAREFLAELQTWARITIATGRSLASAQRYILELGLTNPVVLYHGAVVWDPIARKALFERRIPSEEARRAIAALTRLPVHIQVYMDIGDPNIYVSQITGPIADFLVKENLSVVEVGDLTKFLNRSPIKLLVIGNSDILALAEYALRKKVPSLSVTRSESTYLEVLPPDVSKATGLSWLCAYLGVKWEEVVAVGDQMSDLSMIEQAGLGVAMAHSPALLRNKADLVVHRVDEIRKAIGMAPKGNLI